MRCFAYRLLIFAVLGSTAACAAEPPELPPSAKKLNGVEIARLYDGKTFRFENYTTASLLTGSITHDLKTNTQTGQYITEGESGTFEGRGRVKGDKYCYQSSGGRQTCGWVYRDGDTIYEVNGRGIVDMVKRLN